MQSVLIEDVSFGLRARRGFPGTLFATNEQTIGNVGLLRLMENKDDRHAIATNTIAFANDTGTEISVVRYDVHGTMPTEERGRNGFGFDTIFIPDAYNQTYAEMTPEQKNQISMRRRAIRLLLKGDWQTYQASNIPLWKPYLTLT